MDYFFLSMNLANVELALRLLHTIKLSLDLQLSHVKHSLTQIFECLLCARYSARPGCPIQKNNFKYRLSVCF